MTTSQLEIVDSSEVVAVSEQIFSDLAGEAVILNLKSGVYIGLNEVGAIIWSWIQEPKTVESLQTQLLNEYEVEPELCHKDLIKTLQDLKAAGLIEVRNEATA